MEISLTANKTIVAGRNLAHPNRVQCRLVFKPKLVRFEQVTRKTAAQTAGLTAVRSELPVQGKNGPLPVKNNRLQTGTGPVRLSVGLPLDSVSECNTVNHSKAIAVGLRAIKLLGISAVELPISWGIAVDNDWSSYLAIAEMARDAGLSLRVSLHLYGHSQCHLRLPKCVAEAVKDDQDLLFTDRSGRRFADCLSFAVDELPVLAGKKPVEVFEEFFTSFRSAFAHLFGDTITDITISLGPDGELRYPSFPQSTSDKSFTGVGEFQCYDKYMLADLKRHAEEYGNPLWGLAGPHDAPEYNQSPDVGFFNENGGSWDTPYGQFFLSWYSEKLLSHADRLLSIGSKVFGDLPVNLSAKVPLLHCWHNTRSRPAQLTAGFYNTDSRNGYDAVAKIFARNSCAMIISGMELSDEEEPQGVRSSPQSLLSQIVNACKKNGVEVYGENSSTVEAKSRGFSRIKEHILSENSGVQSFTYQRMGADLFSPDHWPLFTEFVRSMEQMEFFVDDLPNNEEKLPLKRHSTTENDREMQAV